MLTETCLAADNPLDFESQKSYRKVMPLNVRAHLANARKIKFGHDSASMFPQCEKPSMLDSWATLSRILLCDVFKRGLTSK